MKTDHTLQDGLRNKEARAIEFLYWNYFGLVRNYIVLHSGTTEDAEDIFQDSILVLLAKLEDPSFRLTCTVKTFLVAVVKRQWLKVLRERRNNVAMEVPGENLPDIALDADDAREEEHWLSLEIALKRITQFCAKLLSDIFIAGHNSRMYKNQHTFNNQKYKCLLQARKAAEKILQTGG